MKKIMVLAALMLLSISVFAQEGRVLYNKFSGKPNVSAVYISPSMFRLVGNLPDMDLGDGKINLTPIVKSLKGFYILDLSGASRDLKDLLENEVTEMAKSGKYELMMEASDGESRMKLWSAGSKEVINSLLMYADDAFICVDGEIPEEELNKLISAAMK